MYPLYIYYMYPFCYCIYLLSVWFKVCRGALFTVCSLSLYCPVCRPCEKCGSTAIVMIVMIVNLIWRTCVTHLVSLCDRKYTLKGWCLWDLSIKWSVSETCDLSSTIRAGLSCFERESTRAYLSIYFFLTLQNVYYTSLLLHSGYESFTCIFIVCVFYLFIFYTEERNDWVCCIEKILSDRKHSLEPRNLFFRNGSVNISLEGYLEMLSPRTKVTLVSKDKLFFFRSHEVWVWMWMDASLNVLVGLFDRLYVLCIGIFSGFRHHWPRHANGKRERWRKQALFHTHHSIQSIQVNTAAFHILYTKLEGTCSRVLFYILL